MNKVISKRVIAVILSLFSIATASAATVEQETQHLLDYIASSGCTFIRNGSEYSAEKARAHIQRKYNYIKDKISTTEQVIRYAATESSWSGKAYTIKCPDELAEPSAKWLTKELIIYRDKQL